MVKYLLENDKKLISQLKEKQQELSTATSELKKKQNQQADVKKELAGKRTKVRLENSSLQAMLKTVVLEKKIFLQKQKKLDSSKNDLEKEIQKIETARSANARSFEKDLAPTPPPKEVTPATLPDSSPEGAKVMLFNWPVDKAKLKFYKAIGSEKTAALQIEAREQCEILAAGRGKVLYKGAISGLGNVIILGHHKGFSTVYANVGDIWVGMGQIVDKGETIGRLFAQNHPLHFEIRFAGKKQLPLSYLPPLELPDSN
jgi:murein DD-endopeptidase MepM/ murein hydrolase activator NlpD